MAFLHFHQQSGQHLHQCGVCGIEWGDQIAAADGDFALWATACESALWPARTFTRALVAVDDAIDADPGAACVRELMPERSSWAWGYYSMAYAIILRKFRVFTLRGLVTALENRCNVTAAARCLSAIPPEIHTV